MKLKIFLLTVLLAQAGTSFGTYLLIPMDESQSDHLKAYGLAYWTLSKELPVDWLLNYRGGSFMIDHSTLIQNECIIRNISFEII
ncbi:MAG: hypothetical protein ACJASO_001376, partial [Cyclobacteriaceae bacterium]